MKCLDIPGKALPTLVKSILLHQIGGTWKFAIRVDTTISAFVSVSFVKFFHLSDKGESLKAQAQSLPKTALKCHTN